MAGMHKKTYQRGTKVRIPRPEADWVIVDDPNLRIIDEDLWKAVHARFGRKQTFGRKTGRGFFTYG